ncbi:unnamed protein product [Periconia digitata]|uniref:Uncharacterized protein n=1 Tax=Periconia digitata TaxID=1303443 RepID=A0A9W4UKZ4_9PLEO|nr:unnamed protein product [Periconia digitata]
MNCHYDTAPAHLPICSNTTDGKKPPPNSPPAQRSPAISPLESATLHTNALRSESTIYTDEGRAHISSPPFTFMTRASSIMTAPAISSRKAG